MVVQVESQSSSAGFEQPAAFSLGARRVGVMHITDRWPGEGDIYFKLEADDGATYILRHDLASEQWEMTLFAAGSGLSTDHAQPGRQT